MARRINDFQTVRSEGGLLPPDLLRRVQDPKEKLEGTTPQSYGLAPGERLNEVITHSWNRLRKHWAEFRVAAKNLPEGEAGTGLTNDKWSVPLLRELSFGLLPASAAPEVGGKTYAINRFFGATAIHLIGCGLSLDRRAAGVRGAATANPHGLVQDFLNRSEVHLWAILSNGLRLRILRDSQAISRQSFLEFDLEAIFDGEVFSDFVLLWLMAHATRFAARENNRPDSCWLEQWTKLAEEQGTRALGDLRQGVEKALVILGQGFVGHPKNTAIRDALRTNQLKLQDFHGQLLRIVYRLIFLFVAEDRTLDGLPLLHAPDDSEAARIARERYSAHYSAGRLRELASEIRGSRHGDLWWQLNLVIGALSGAKRFEAMREQLALPVLGSFLWSPESTTALNAPSLAEANGAELANVDLLEAIRNLAFTRQNRALRPVDYKNLGAEELGGVYEGLLALTPQVSGDGNTFTFAEFAGNERKTSGSYYTPDSLVQCLLDSALDPVVSEAIKGKRGADAEKAILALKVCDPSVGSGHFLVGAAHRLARHLARVRAAAQGDGEPSPGFYQHALRDVIGRCLYGVDIMPMAAELCRVSLWLEALDPGKPLSFLDHHIRVGNSLLGTTPEVIAGGLPDDAFSAIEGDDKRVCAQLKKQNKQEREGFEQSDLLSVALHRPVDELRTIASRAQQLDETTDDTIEHLEKKADSFRRLVVSPEYRHAQQIADAWCAAFVWPKTESTFTDVVTSGWIKRLEADPDALSSIPASDVERLANRYQFFHWHLAFPEVFAKGGFDCIVGNPPWDKVQPEEEAFFASRRPDISGSTSSVERKKLIAGLATSDPTLYAEWTNHRRDTEALSLCIKGMGRFPLSSQGNLNLYRCFVESAVSHLGTGGRAGLIVQTALATGESGKELFSSLLSAGQIKRFLDFENRGGFFPDVDTRFRFCLLTLAAQSQPPGVTSAEFGWLLGSLDELRDPLRLMPLSIDDIRLFNPTSLTCPVFRDRREFELTHHMYSRAVHVSVAETDRFASIRLLGELFNLTRDAKHFVDPERSETESTLPLYEAKYLYQFDHRYRGAGDAGSESSRSQPGSHFETRKRVLAAEVMRRLNARGIASRWLLGFRRIASGTNERTAIMAFFPCSAVGNTINLAFNLDAMTAAVFACNVNSLAFDFCCRQKVSGTDINLWIFEQLPAIPFDRYQIPDPALGGGHSLANWLLPRVLELTYTASDLEAFAKDCGFDGPPFQWDETRRFLLRCELDAAFFHLYLPSDSNGDWLHSDSEEDRTRLRSSFSTPRDAVSYIMDTFPIMKRKDEEAYGSYRTKTTILAMYDEVQQAISLGKAYQTHLDPPPAEFRVAHDQILENLSVPDIVDLYDEGEYLARFIWAVLHANKGTVTRTDLVRAFSLRNQPEELVKLAPAQMKALSSDWAVKTGERSMVLGAIIEMLRQLEQRDGVRFAVDTAGHSIVCTTAGTPPAEALGAWFVFEAMLTLRVLASLTPYEIRQVDSGVSGDDRVLLQAG